MTKHDADANDNINDCVTKHDADANDNINDCVTLHDADAARCVHHWPLPLTPHERAWSARIVSSLLFSASHHLVRTHRGSRCLSLSHHPHGHLHVSVSPRVDSLFLFPALPHVPYLLPPVPEVCGKPAHSAKREYGLHRRVLPLHRLWAQGLRLLRDLSRALHTKALLRTPTTMTLHSKTCSTKHIERKPITLYEKTCLSVCRRRQCPIERGDPLEIEGRPGEHRNSEAQIRTLLDKQKK